jgi:hypothetical protein
MNRNIYIQAEIELFNYLTRPSEPMPPSTSEPAISNRDTNVVYAEPIGENSEITDLKQKIKTLEDKVRDLNRGI